MHNFRPQAEALRDELIATRRDFHQHPETAFEEVRTAGIVAQRLNDLGLEVQTGVGKTGVVAILEGDQDGPTVLMRCDMDALPMEENNAVDYRSQTAQKMHACGHDGHTAIGLAVAKMLNERRADLRGRVKFIFQPAEEIAQGANAMIDDGVLGDPKPDVSLGLHLWNELPVGSIGMAPGGSMAGADIFNIKLQGRGGHGAIPNQTVDPVLAAAQITTAVQSIVSRNISPLDSAVVSVTRIIAGDAHNIIPDTVAMQGTIRTMETRVRDVVVARFEEIVKGVAEAMGCSAEVNVQQLTPPLMNDAATVDRLQNGFNAIAPDLTYRNDVRTMGAEDMAVFLDKVPGVFFFVGSANDTLNYPHHHPRFDFDEEALVIGAALLASAVGDYVLAEG